MAAEIGQYDDYDEPFCERNPGHHCEFQEDDRSAEMVCRFCGRCGHRILSRTQAKVFEHGDEKNLNADEGKQFGQIGTVLGSIYNSNPTGLTQGYVGRDRTLKFTTKKSAKDKLAEVIRHELEDQCTLMKLKRKTTDDCLNLFDAFVRESPSLQKKQKIKIMLGCIFLACKKNDDTRTIPELARQTKREVKEVQSGIKLIQKKCEASRDRSTLDPINLVARYCRVLNMKPDFMNLFVANAHVVAQYVHQYLEGKRPNTEAATYIALTYEWFYDGKARWNEHEIANVTQVQISTLKGAIKKVNEELAAHKLTSAQIVADAESLHPTDS